MQDFGGLPTRHIQISGAGNREMWRIGQPIGFKATGSLCVRKQLYLTLDSQKTCAADGLTAP